MLNRAIHYVCLLGLSSVLLNPAHAKSLDHVDILGTWATQGYGAQVVITPCGQAGEKLCGQIAWLWTDRDAAGNPLRDEENPVARLRNRPLIGAMIFRNFVREADGQWRGDGIYNPEDGNTYSASLSPRPDGTLNITGCVLGIFCQTQIWRRPQSVCPADAHRTRADLTQAHQD